MPGSAHAVSVGGLEPDPNWTKQQKAEFWIGVITIAGERCGYYSDAEKVKEIAKLSPYGRQGMKLAGKVDTFSGCARVHGTITKLINQKANWIASLTSRYAGSGSAGTQAGSASTTKHIYCHDTIKEMLYMAKRECFKGDEIISEEKYSKLKEKESK